MSGVAGAAGKIRIESLGVHLPETVLATEELMRRCARRPRLDLEAITGIRERRVASGEHALDLAVRAAERALALSRYGAGELEAVVCTSISKHHRDDEFTLEPATAVLVRRAIGARRALVFDVVNACAGMLNGLWVLRALIGAGVVRNGMVVSGEQNLPLAESATREIRHSLDRQLAALTLGDAGAALIVEAAADERFAVHHLDLVTGAKHDHYCRSLPSPRGRGGILLTKARGLQRKGAEHFPAYLKRALDVTGWSLDDLQHVIPHQVSVRAVRQGVKALARAFGCEMPGVFRCCAERFGNTTTTSHFVALHELMLGGEANAGDNVLLVSGASGIVIAHATLTLDDLPERYRERWAEKGTDLFSVDAGRATEADHGKHEKGTDLFSVKAGRATEVTMENKSVPFSVPVSRRVRIASVGVSLAGRWPWRRGSVAHAVAAGRRCLAASQLRPADIGVLISAGVYRDRHVAEPAIAAYIQHRLGVNIEFQGRPTLSFDLINGGCGMLNAAQVVAAALQTGRVEAGLVVAGEANSDRRPDAGSLVARSGAAVLLDLAPRAGTGFEAFAFQTHEEDAELFTAVVSLAVPRGRLLIRKQARLEEAWLGYAAAAVEEALAGAGVTREQVDLVVPSQVSPGFLARLPAAIGLPAAKVSDFTAELPDTGSTSVFLAWHRLLGERPPGPGTTVLFLAFGSGLTVGAALYRV